MLGAIEAGGTKFVCAVAKNDLEILQRIEIPTESPEETMPKVMAFFEENPVEAIGIGSFGPIDVDEASAHYGTIGNTPKQAWQSFNYLEALSSLEIPIYITTDVNAAAYGEYIADGSLASCTYFTVGTGVGGGHVSKGEILNGLSHPEMGHMVMKKHPDDDYEGYCLFHADCLEGLACGPSIFERTAIKGQDLDKDHAVFDYLAYYLAQAAHNITLIQSPEKIIFGGGVSKKPDLIEKIRKEYQKLMADYVQVSDLERYIVCPILGDNAGSFGCLALAKRKLEEEVLV